MAINMAAIEQIVALLDRIIGAQATAAQQQRLESLFQTLLNQGNEIIAREQSLYALLSQILNHVSGGQTQSAANSLVLAQTYRAVVDAPSKIASGVWQEVNQFTQVTYEQAMQWITFEAAFDWYNNSPHYSYSSPHFAVFTYGADPSYFAAIPIFPTWDDSQILPTDDLPTYLNRVSNYSPWVQEVGAPHQGYYYWFSNIPNFPFGFVCLMDTIQFERHKSAILNPASITTNVPPVWPGLSRVTLGSTVAIAPPTQTVPGPMDGVLVNITAVPTPVGYYQFGPDKSFVKIGGVAFQTDDGYDEEAQPVSFQQHIITPRRQVRAQSALFRWVTGVQGTITPWTIT